MTARILASLAFALLASESASAGDVTATLQRETLVLKGDDQGADLILSPPAELSRGVGSTVQVAPQGGTTVNGAAVAVTFEPVEDVKITLGDGAGTVLFDQISLPGNLSFKSGSGADTLTFVNSEFGDGSKIGTGEGAGTVVIDLDSSFGDDLSVKAGSGADTLDFGGGVIGSLKVNLGAGANTFVGGGSVGDAFSQKGGDGADTLDALGFQVGGNAKVKLGPGANALTLDTGTQIGETLKFKGGTGVDAITTNAAQIGETLNLNLAAGNNTVSLTDTQIGEDLVVKAGGGDDTIQILGTTAIGDEQKINTDGGTDVGP